MSEGPVLTLGQMALVLAAFHSNYVSVHCPGMEKIFVVPPTDWAPSGPERAAYGKYVRWTELKSRVRKLGDWAEPWLSVLWANLSRSLHQQIPAEPATAKLDPVDAQPESAPSESEISAPQLSQGPGPLSEALADPETQAIAVMIKNPGFSIQRIAEIVGVDRKTLYKWPRFLDSAQKAGVYSPKVRGAGYHTKGSKSQGIVEAQKDCADEDE
jgi:hypothetical protein